MLELACPLHRAVIHATAAIPAFIGIYHNGGLAFFFVGQKYIGTAYLDACITAGAILSKYNWDIRH
jgi:hypothetical protein